jgi:hypothetical protein
MVLLFAKAYETGQREGVVTPKAPKWSLHHAVLSDPSKLQLGQGREKHYELH